MEWSKLKKKNRIILYTIIYSCQFISACGLNPCEQGRCQNINATDFQCICKPGFTGNKRKLERMILRIHLGTTCDISFDICITNPCK
jgi:hypothetical protein